jgi:hypothetical protein
LTHFELLDAERDDGFPVTHSGDDERRIGVEGCERDRPQL